MVEDFLKMQMQDLYLDKEKLMKNIYYIYMIYLKNL